MLVVLWSPLRRWLGVGCEGAAAAAMAVRRPAAQAMAVARRLESLREDSEVEPSTVASPLPRVFRRPARAAIAPGLKPLTPFVQRAADLPRDAAARAADRTRAEASRRAGRQLWAQLGPQRAARAAISGSFAEVCGALEELAALEALALRAALPGGTRVRLAS